jgi:hypothetical protein
VTSEIETPVAKDAAALAELMFPSTVRCLSVVADKRIADLLADGPRHVRELAEQSGTSPVALAKVLRLLSEDGVFMELEAGVFANTLMSQYLRPGVPGSLHAMARMVGEPWMWTCWGGLDTTVDTGAPAFDKAYSTNLWAWFAGNPQSARLFNDAMTEFSDAFSAQLASAYPEFGQAATIADLGGGLGSYLATILATYPAIGRGILSDLPRVIDQARSRPELASVVEAGRYLFAPGDFFDAVPEGVDIYVTKQIMHSWQDEQLVRVLQRCRESSPSARIVAAEFVNDEEATRFVKNFDLVMMITMNGSVRSADQFAGVYRQAGYQVSRIIPTETHFSLIEAVPF